MGDAGALRGRSNKPVQAVPRCLATARVARDVLAPGAIALSPYEREADLVAPRGPADVQRRRRPLGQAVAEVACESRQREGTAAPSLELVEARLVSRPV